MDFFATTDVAVALTAAGGTLEGMYEALPNAEFKSGRFKTRDPMVLTNGVPLITTGSGNGKAIYRIFNSGTISLQLFTQNLGGGGEAPFGNPIPAEESLDFATPANKIILVKGQTTGATDHIEGIYDLLARI
jgi:hypothetical protein